MKITWRINALLRRGTMIEVGTAGPKSKARPGYRWVQGWQVLDPRTNRWSHEMRRKYALVEADRILAEIRAVGDSTGPDEESMSPTAMRS